MFGLGGCGLCPVIRCEGSRDTNSLLSTSTSLLQTIGICLVRFPLRRVDGKGEKGEKWIWSGKQKTLSTETPVTDEFQWFASFLEKTAVSSSPPHFSITENRQLQPNSEIMFYCCFRMWVSILLMLVRTAQGLQWDFSFTNRKLPLCLLALLALHSWEPGLRKASLQPPDLLPPAFSSPVHTSMEHAFLCLGRTSE